MFPFRTPDGSPLYYQLPLTIEFQTTQNSFSQVNTINIKLYNLNQHDRNLLRKNMLDVSRGMDIVLQAGYQGDMGTVFIGTVVEAYSQREGVDFITYIVANDSGFAFTSSNVDITFGSGTPRRSIIQTLLNSLNIYGVKTGKIGNYPGSIGKTTSYSGNPTKLLDQETGGGFLVSNGTGHCLNSDEALPGDAIVIDAASGLLNTPSYQQTYLDVDILFEPKLQMMGLVRLQSITAPNYNKDGGIYQVKSISHRATISETIAGDAVSHVGLWTSNFKQLK